MENLQPALCRQIPTETPRSTHTVLSNQKPEEGGSQENPRSRDPDNMEHALWGLPDPVLFWVALLSGCVTPEHGDTMAEE